MSRKDKNGFKMHKHNNLKKWLCGAAIVGGSCLYLSQHSEFFTKTQEKDDSAQTITVPDRPEDAKKLIGYSMTDAFKYGVINSISDYVEQAPYKVDTTNFAGDFQNQVIEFGYYAEINGRKTVVLTHINPDTLSIPEASPFVKKMICKFAEFHNSQNERATILAHEFAHQATDPDKKIGSDIQLSQKTDRSIFEYNMTAEEFELICNHDEMRGRINGLLYKREQYKKYGKSSVFNGDYSFYGRALRSGKIDPFSTDPQEIANEQLFCVKSIREQYEREHIEHYEKYTIDRLGAEHIAFDPRKPDEYHKALDQVYTFIWDGQLVNMNFYSNGQLPELRLTDNEYDVAKAKDISDSSKCMPKNPKNIMSAALLLSKKDQSR